MPDDKTTPNIFGSSGAADARRRAAERQRDGEERLRAELAVQGEPGWGECLHFAAKLGIIDAPTETGGAPAVRCNEVGAYAANLTRERNRRQRRIRKALCYDFALKNWNVLAWADVAEVLRAECDRRGLLPGTKAEPRQTSDRPKHLSAADIAEHFGCTPGAARAKLNRWRRNHHTGFMEVPDPGPKDARYLYDFDVIRDLFENARRD